MSGDIGIEFSDESLRKIAEQKIKFRLSVRVHAVIYILINLMLVIINLLTFSGRIYWFMFPMLGWGTGLAMHATAYSLYARGVYPIAKRGVIFHLVAYIMVNLLLIVIDIGLFYRFSINTPRWFYFAAVPWGVAWLLHALVYVMFFSGKLTEEGIGKTRREKAVEKELRKMKEKIDRAKRHGEMM